MSKLENLEKINQSKKNSKDFMKFLQSNDCNIADVDKQILLNDLENEQKMLEKLVDYYKNKPTNHNADLSQDIEEFNLIFRDNNIQIDETDCDSFDINFTIKQSDMSLLTEDKLLFVERIKKTAFLEIVQSLSKIVCNKIYSLSNNQVELNLSDIKLILKENKLKDNYDTLISNGNVVSCLQDMSGYHSNTYQILNTNGVTYPMGVIENCKIYVDPYKKWDDNTLVIVHNNFFNFKLNLNDFENLDIKIIGTFAPIINVGKIYYKFNNIEADYYKILNIDTL